MGGAGKSTILALAAGEDANNLEPTKGGHKNVSKIVLLFCLGFNIKAIATSKVILNVKELGGM